MIDLFVKCEDCSGSGVFVLVVAIRRCKSCDGTGRMWAPGAPSYGCSAVLGDTIPGEIVTLGNGQQVRVLWHMPRRTKNVRPEMTFVGEIEPFTEIESHRPVPCPSCVGVRSVDVSRAVVEDVSHANERSVDYGDPMHRRIAGRLL